MNFLIQTIEFHNYTVIFSFQLTVYIMFIIYILFIGLYTTTFRGIFESSVLIIRQILIAIIKIPLFIIPT